MYKRTMLNRAAVAGMRRLRWKRGLGRRLNTINHKNNVMLIVKTREIPHGGVV